ncbi:3-ketosteroid-9-alpha-monooxygenase oxygenase subunit [compost metagenome]
MRAVFEGMEIHSILLNCHVPITANSFELRFGCMVKKVPGWSEEQNREMAKDYVMRNRESFYQDVDIWAHKIRVNNPVLAEGDGPVYQLREWYEQFFMDEASVPPTMAERREIITVGQR